MLCELYALQKLLRIEFVGKYSLFSVYLWRPISFIEVMMGMSHAAFGLFMYGLVAGTVGDVTLSHMAVAVLAALIPDVDQPQSALGMIFFPVSRWLNRKYGHRTATHCLRFVVIIRK
jgi:hypothetical protein